jgi:hypothetical protein
MDGIMRMLQQIGAALMYQIIGIFVLRCLAFQIIVFGVFLLRWVTAGHQKQYYSSHQTATHNHPYPERGYSA